MKAPRIFTVLAIISAIWSASIWETGGLRFTVFGADVRSTDPFRPLAFAFACLLLRIFVFPQRSVWHQVVDAARAVTPSIFCWTMAAAVFIVGAVRGSAVAGGADQYGYVSQADLWLRGDLVTPHLEADRVPWPDGQWTFSPLGYRPALDRHAIVPTYAPGLPLLRQLSSSSPAGNVR